MYDFLADRFQYRRITHYFQIILARNLVRFNSRNAEFLQNLECFDIIKLFSATFMLLRRNPLIPSIFSCHFHNLLSSSTCSSLFGKSKLVMPPFSRIAFAFFTDFPHKTRKNNFIFMMSRQRSNYFRGFLHFCRSLRS